MKDISLHLLDVIENAAKAGSSQATVSLRCAETLLFLAVRDNGPGLPETVAEDPTDPYRTTRTERPVGLGLAFLREAAESTGGRLTIASTPGEGVALEATFDMAHIDAKPMGDIAGALLTAALGWPMDLVVHVGEADECVLDTEQVRKELEGVPLSHPQVRHFLEAALAEGLADLQARMDLVFDRSGAPRGC